MIIRTQAYPRAGLIGNPSDGYFGKTISFTFGNFRAEVMLYETPELEILPNTRDHSPFDSIRHLAEDVRLYGYYGGIRLLKAAVKRFHDYCREQRHRAARPQLHDPLQLRHPAPGRPGRFQRHHHRLLARADGLLRRRHPPARSWPT